MAVEIDPGSKLPFNGGSSNDIRSNPPPEAPVFAGWSRGRGSPLSAIFHVPSIISAVQRGSPMLVNIGLALRDSDPVGQFLTQ